MGVHSYDELVSHVGHEVEIVTYGGNLNVAVECVDCSTVLLDFDNVPPPLWGVSELNEGLYYAVTKDYQVGPFASWTEAEAEADERNKEDQR